MKSPPAIESRLPQSFGGVIPAYSQVADFGPPRSEIGIGCLMPWRGDLYILNYSSHRRSSGTGTGLRVIDGTTFEMRRHPAAVDGTFANRFVHSPTSQLIIGPHVIDTEGNVRTVEALIDVRLCGTASHLEKPETLVYMLGMEGELFELDVVTLEHRLLFDLTQELGTPGEMKCHFKDCYTGCGRLVVTNNDYSEPDFLGEKNDGTLAEFDGTQWKVLERKPFICVNGLGHFGETIFANGWDRASAILKVYTAADERWTTYRLPKASHTHDHKWQTEWPRIRSVEHERFLMDLHGMFYEFSPWAYGNRIWGVRPISSHLWVHGDFCSWKGMLVIGSDNASHDSGANHQCAEPQSGIWMGRTEDLWNLGKPTGWGGPWWDSAVEAGVASDPYLMTGFDNKCLHLTHRHDADVDFEIGIDFLGTGDFRAWKTIRVAPGGYEAFCFPSGFSAHWMQITASSTCTATAQFHYT